MLGQQHAKQPGNTSRQDMRILQEAYGSGIKRCLFWDKKLSKPIANKEFYKSLWEKKIYEKTVPRLQGVFWRAPRQTSLSIPFSMKFSSTLL